MAAYPYQPLSIDKNEIRLIVLQPGEGQSIVEATLTHASLDDPPAYEAISYVWGDPAITAPIRLVFEKQDGEKDLEPTHVSFEATSNLEAAFRHLRYSDRTRILWADAICINEGDVVEKGHQIRRMGQVYAKASRVCIWLGVEADDSNFAMDLLDYSSAHIHEDLVLLFKSELHYDVKRIRPFRAMTYLVSRPWFSRRWVVQEVGIASDHLVCCGRRSTTWSGLGSPAFSFTLKHGCTK